MAKLNHLYVLFKTLYATWLLQNKTNDQKRSFVVNAKKDSIVIKISRKVVV